MKMKRSIILSIVSFVFLFLNMGSVSFAGEGISEGGYRFLVGQRNDRTGLPDSFINTDDPALFGQAATYDMALAGLAFLKLGDKASAQKMLVFFDRAWKETGFCNFYHTRSGACGLETIAHLGPNMWVAVLALRYTVETGDERFYPLARKIAAWGMRLKHEQGGLAMGATRDWGSDWPNVFGAESNVVAYSVFRSMALMEKNRADRIAFELEMQGIRDFINKVAIQRDERGRVGKIIAGYSLPAGASNVAATDVISMMLLVFNTRELQEFFGVNEIVLSDLAEAQFFVQADGISGFDFTDESGARAIPRARMISLEWTMQMACGLQEHAEPRARAWVNEVDKKMIRAKGAVYYAYSTKPGMRVFPFAPWWKTPRGGETRCGSMASTMWRLFYEKNFNPLEI